VLRERNQPPGNVNQRKYLLKTKEEKLVRESKTEFMTSRTDMQEMLKVFRE
jgi:hypothetical protein